MQISLEDCSEQLQDLLQKAEQSNAAITITRAGNPFAMIQPIPVPKTRPSFGFMKGTGDILGDIVSPDVHFGDGAS